MVVFGTVPMLEMVVLAVVLVERIILLEQEQLVKETMVVPIKALRETSQVVVVVVLVLLDKMLKAHHKLALEARVYHHQLVVLL